MPLSRNSIFRNISCFFLCLITFHSYSTDLLVVTEHSPPYQYLNKSGNIEGLTTEIVHAAFAETSLSYQLKLYPWSRAFLMAKETENTCIFLMSRDEPREKHFQWIAPLIKTNDYFVGL